jgi:hypothetical protein
MDGEALEIALRPNQTLDRLTGRDGVVMTIPPANGAPARTVQGRTVDASAGDDGSLTSAKFAGGVVFTERTGAGGDRTAKASVLDLAMKDDAVSSAVFTDHATFTDGDLTAASREARYEPAAGKLHLRQRDEGRTPPQVADDRVSI